MEAPPPPADNNKGKAPASSSSPSTPPSSSPAAVAPPVGKNPIEKREDLPHTFYKKNFSTPTYCNVCKAFLWGLRKQGMCCEVCKYVAHEKCVPAAPKSCYSMIYADEEKSDSPLLHHWVEGNLPLGCKCTVCNHSIVTLGLGDASRCSRCEETVHNQCLVQNAKAVPSCNPPHLNMHDIAEDFKQCAGASPLVVFVNSRSGGGQGAWLMRKFKRLLPPEQVFDLAQGGPKAGLLAYKDSGKPYRVLVCGGDGSAGWVLGVMDKILTPPYPPVAILPLGTGNDLARVLNWGGGYADEPLSPILRDVEDSVITGLDRWNVAVQNNPPSEKDKRLVMNNYFSFGIDAKIALSFHELRESNPALFPHRAVNKAWYGHFGMQEMVKFARPLESFTTLLVDDVEKKLPEGLASLIILNIPSYSGGSDLWGEPSPKKGFTAMSMNDGILEVVGVKGVFHMGRIQAKLAKGVKVAQGRKIQLITREIKEKDFAMQLDGEPWAQGSCTVTIEFHNRVNMLMKPERAAQKKSSAGSTGPTSNRVSQSQPATPTASPAVSGAHVAPASEPNLSTLDSSGKNSNSSSQKGSAPMWPIGSESMAHVLRPSDSIPLVPDADKRAAVASSSSTALASASSVASSASAASSPAPAPSSGNTNVSPSPTAASPSAAATSTSSSSNVKQEK